MTDIAYFDDRKKDKSEIAKERAKLQEHAKKKQEEYDRMKAEAERIKDPNFVQGQLVGIKMRDERREAARNARIQASTGAVLSRLDIEHMTCELCKVKIDVDNLTCPQCGLLYCQYCGAKMNMESPGQCPRCGGVPNYTPAPLVVTTVEDIPPEDRFWESLPECPKCKAAVQPDWDECPFCGYKMLKGTAPAGPTEHGPKKERKAAAPPPEETAEPAAEPEPEPEEEAEEEDAKKKKKRAKEGI